MEMLAILPDIDPSQTSELQVSCLKELDKIFIRSDIKDMTTDHYFYKGLRGKYADKKVYSIHFRFTYNNYSFCFDLAYDQLECVIYQQEAIVYEINLEDFWEDTIFVQKFITYLKKELIRLKIVSNENHNF
ncbi:hypothetical protein [Flavobacterium sp. CAU 1735]|uniref:hypothetical protein n=1 Tax=Flavobacterium sp. CAU 1735 TaxID=3140361 RepID=UPI00325FFECF